MVKMTKYDLQIFSGSIVTESKLSKPAKLQMLTWLQHEATEAQLKAFILDGSITKLDKQAEQIVNDRFENHRLNEVSVDQGFGRVIVTLTQGEVSVAGVLAATAIAWWAIKAAKNISTAKECKDYKTGTPGYKKCHVMVKIKKLEAQISAINAKSGLCAKSKDPAKCKAKLEGKIAKIKANIANAKRSI
jgi:hypothetical protein